MVLFGEITVDFLEYPEYKNDKEIVLTAVQQYGAALQYISDNLKKR